MSQQQLYSIGIYEEAILLTDHTGKHDKRFVVDEKELMKLFRFKRELTFKPFDGLVWMKSDPHGKDTYLVTLPRAKRKIIYHEKDDGVKLKHITVEMPKTLIRASVENNNLEIDTVWLYKNHLNKQTQLFQPPLPNMGRNSFCQGGARIPVNGDIMKAVHNALFETPFNHHQHLVGNQDLPFLKYIEKHKGKMPFKSLISAGYCRTLLEG